MRFKGSLALLIWIAAGLNVVGPANAQNPAIGLMSSDTNPTQLGPMIEASSIKASSAEVKVLPRGDSFRLDFPADPGRPQALFLLPTRDLSSRLGMSVDIRNLSSQPLRVYGKVNENMWSSGYVLYLQEVSARCIFISTV